MGLKLFSQTYCFVAGYLKSAHFNCDGSVQYYSDYTCTTPSGKTLPESSSDTCLYVAPGSGSGKAIQYTCNTVTPTVNWITVSTYSSCSNSGNPVGSSTPNAWASYACNICSPTGTGTYGMITCSQSNNNINFYWGNYSQPDCSVPNLLNTYPSKVLPLSTCQARTQLGNPLKPDEIISMNSQFDYAVYGFIKGSNPPSPPIPGSLKRYLKP